MMKVRTKEASALIPSTPVGRAPAVAVDGNSFFENMLDHQRGMLLQADDLERIRQTEEATSE